MARGVVVGAAVVAGGPLCPVPLKQLTASLQPLHDWTGPAPSLGASAVASTSLLTASQGPMSTWLKAQPGLAGLSVGASGSFVCHWSGTPHHLLLAY